MKYIVDRIYDDYVVLENYDTKEMTDIKKELLPDDIRDGNVLIYVNDTYYIDKSLEETRRISIQERFNKLRNKTP